MFEHSHRLANKVALITGGGRGIGAAIAERFAGSGAQTLIMGRSRELLENVAARTGSFPVVGDVTRRPDCSAAVDRAISSYGKLDIVVASAGAIAHGTVLEVGDDDWRHINRVNVDGVREICRAAIPHMIGAGGGAIVVLSSILAMGQKIAAYYTSKHAVVGLVKSMAADFAASGIRANAICPGWVDTEITEWEMREIAKERNVDVARAYERAVRYVPMQRMADPQEIAACAEFLASEDASFVTGTTLVVDGGGETMSVSALYE